MSNHTQQTMMIFKIIYQIEQFIEMSPRPKINGAGKRLINEGDLMDLLGDLKATIPEDIRRANSTLLDAESILDQAKEQADEVLHNAHAQADDMLHKSYADAEQMRAEAEKKFQNCVIEHEVYQEAVRAAERLQQRAKANANVVYQGAKQYADDILQDVQRYLMQYHSLVEQNRAELGVKDRSAQSAPQPVQEPIPYNDQPERYDVEERDDDKKSPFMKRNFFKRRTEAANTDTNQEPPTDGPQMPFDE